MLLAIGFVFFRSPDATRNNHYTYLACCSCLPGTFYLMFRSMPKSKTCKNIVLHVDLIPCLSKWITCDHDRFMPNQHLCWHGHIETFGICKWLRGFHKILLASHRLLIQLNYLRNDSSNWCMKIRLPRNTKSVARSEGLASRRRYQRVPQTAWIDLVGEVTLMLYLTWLHCKCCFGRMLFKAFKKLSSGELESW